MNNEEVLEKVSDAVAIVLSKDSGEISGESMLEKDLGAESIDFIDISFELENTLGYEVDFKDVIAKVREKKGDENIKDMSIGDVVGYIVEKQ